MKKRIHDVCRVLSVTMTAIFIMSGLSAVSAADMAGSETEIDPLSAIPAPIISSGDFGYQNNEDGTITIAEYTGTEQDIIIPDEIDGFTVSQIGYQAFTYKEMNSLVIPSTVETIGSRAFEYCKIRDALVLPENITVSSSAFSYAELPAVVYIPAGAELKKDAFSYCKNLEILIIDQNAIAEEAAFSYSKQLKSVVCAENVCLKEDSFEYCYSLEQVILCGEVDVDGDAFDHSGSAQISNVGADDFYVVLEAMQEEITEPKDVTPADGPKYHSWFQHE